MPIAYAQLLSMGQIANFGNLQQFRRQLGQIPRPAAAAATAARAPDESFVMVDPDSLRFD